MPTDLLWSFEELHERLIDDIGAAFVTLESQGKISKETWNNTYKESRMTVSQGCLLGTGGDVKHKEGGLWKLSIDYAREKLNCNQQDAENLSQDLRCYARYNDFQLYTYVNDFKKHFNCGPKRHKEKHPWYDGAKRLVLIVEVENNSNELLGEFAGLLQVRCPIKYLFIRKDKILDEINTFCCDEKSFVNELPETHLWISEIPQIPTSPRNWTYHHAHVRNDGKIKFEQYQPSP
ncbi:MAG: hypothetical protein ABSA77_09100 [Thermoguttaceae bacterium]|jgi:hypothetical protein